MPVSPPRHVRPERGFSTLEALVAGGLVATAAISVALAFGANQNAATRSTQDELARDVSTSLDADATALAGYSPAVRTTLENLSPMTAVVTTPSGPATVSLAGSSAQATLAVRVRAGGASGEEIVPLPNPRPTP